MERELYSRFSFPSSQNLKDKAVEKTSMQIKKMRAGHIPPSELIREVEITEDGSTEPLESKPAFAALDAGLQVDMDAAAELLGKYATKQGRFNTVKFVRDAPKALYAIGFDPIIELVRNYREIEEEIERHRSGVKRLSAMMYTELVKTRSNIAASLVRYGYTYAREEGSDQLTPVFNIILEGEDEEDAG